EKPAIGIPTHHAASHLQYGTNRQPTGGPMTRTVHCAKLDRDAEGLDFAPWPGELGKRIYNEISREAWNQWLAHQTTLINENRLNPLDPKARKFLADEMENFLFGEGSAPPPGFEPPEPPAAA